MSTADTPPSSDPEHPSPSAASGASRPRGTEALPVRRSSGTLGLALLLALLAVLAAGYVGWRQWESARGSAVERVDQAALQQRVATLESALEASAGERAELKQQLARLLQQDQGLSTQVPALEQRTRNLEDAVATLAERTRSGREPMLLDETESLLRMGMERYQLFNDARGAQRAYALADQTLAAVDDGVFSPVRQAIHAERDALTASHPQSDEHVLRQLQALRGSVAALPLAPQESPVTAQDGFWTRIGHALGGALRVQRDHGGPLELQDGRFARELLALDLAQAQAALLAHDDFAYRAALQRADSGLSTQFDAAAPAVEEAGALLRPLLATPASAPVQLGAALTELRNLRAVHALRPAAAASAPASPVPAAAHAPAAGRRP